MLVGIISGTNEETKYRGAFGYGPLYCVTSDLSETLEEIKTRMGGNRIAIEELVKGIKDGSFLGYTIIDATPAINVTLPENNNGALTLMNVPVLCFMKKVGGRVEDMFYVKGINLESLLR